MGLDRDCSSFHAKELLPFDVHLEHRLNFERSSIVPFPVLLALVGSDVVDLLDCSQ